MKKVSVLVPIYGTEKYIARCAESLFSQSYTELEYLFVNDCSPDKSIMVLLGVLEKFPDRKCQVRIIEHEHNRGLAVARNTAYNNATGDFVCVVDSDDWLERDAIKLLMAKQKETDADIVTGWSYQLTDKGKLAFLQPTYSTRDEMLGVMCEHSFNHTIWGRVIRRSLLEDNHIRNMENLNQGEDYYVMMLSTFFAKKVATISQFVYNYNRVNEQSMCSNWENRKYTDKWRQDKENHFEAMKFLFKQGGGYVDLAGESSVRYLMRYMHMAAKVHDKSYFYELKSELVPGYKQYYYAIGFNNPIIRLFCGNYYIFGSFIRLRSYIYQKLVRLVSLFKKRATATVSL